MFSLLRGLLLFPTVYTGVPCTHCSREACQSEPSSCHVDLLLLVGVLLFQSMLALLLLSFPLLKELYPSMLVRLLRLLMLPVRLLLLLPQLLLKKYISKTFFS